MHRFAFLCLIIGLFTPMTMFGQQQGEPREFEMTDGDTSYTMKRYYFGMYLRGEKAGDYDTEALEALQAKHMAHMNEMAEAGKLVMAGPFGDDGDWRGIVVFDVKTLEEAEALMASDPAVQAGRLKYEIHPWWAAKGTKLP